MLRFHVILKHKQPDHPFLGMMQVLVEMMAIAILMRIEIITITMAAVAKMMIMVIIIVIATINHYQ